MNVEFINQSVKFVGGYGGAETIESAARTCTQTDGKGNPSDFVRNLIKRGHMSPIEFGFADFLIECDRAIQQELTRHRHHDFNIESTRLCDYRKKPLRYVTKPPEDMEVPELCIESLEEYCALGARLYESWSNAGVTRDYLRKFLTLALASRMRMGGNLRAWLETIPKRISKHAHAEVREVARKVLAILKYRFVGVFEDIDPDA